MVGLFFFPGAAVGAGKQRSYLKNEAADAGVSVLALLKNRSRSVYS